MGTNKSSNNLKREELDWSDPNPSGREGDLEGEVEAGLGCGREALGVGMPGTRGGAGDPSPAPQS